MSEIRAAMFDEYGLPEVLYVGTVPKPVAAPGEVLVRVHATSVNGGELAGRAGKLKLVTGRRFPQRAGIDFTTLGSSHPGLKVGDRVWGTLPRGKFGSAAEFVAVRPRQVALVPAGLDLVRTAALPTGTTAITALRDKTRLKAGERLLVRGASGGVGYVAVQLRGHRHERLPPPAGAGRADGVDHLRHPRHGRVDRLHHGLHGVRGKHLVQVV